jgi:ribosomal protein S25
LYENKKNQIVELTHSQYAIHTLDFLFSRPIFKSSEFTKTNEIPTPTAKRILSVLRDNGIVQTIRSSSGRRSAIYAFAKLINTAERRNVI